MNDTKHEAPNEAACAASALDDGLERIFQDAMSDMRTIKARITKMQGGVEPDLWQFASGILFVALLKAVATEREACAKACEAERDRILSKQSGLEGDAVDINLRMTAWAGADPCAAAIRARSNA